MQPHLRFFRTMFVAAIVVFQSLAHYAAAQSNSALTSQKFRLTRSISGTKGHEQSGRYVIDDARTVFKVPDDRQVLVYCEWEGVPGQHEFEGHWMNPAGKVVAVSDFKLEVRERRCAGFFTLLLSETTETGIWTLDAKVDGESTGQHKFQIESATDPAKQTTGAAQPATTAKVVTPDQARQPLTESQVYDIATASTVLLEKLDAKGSRIDFGVGFFVDRDLILTAFQVIDGASGLRITLPDGRKFEIHEALSWDKWQDLAFLKIAPDQQKFFKLLSAPETSVGNRVFALSVSREGVRVLVRCDIVGKNRYERNGDRINLNCSHPDVIGSPLLDEYGDLIGVVGGSLVPGWGSIKAQQNYYTGAPIANPVPGMLAVPISSSAKAAAAQTTTPFTELMSGGIFITLLSRTENIQFGTLSKRVEPKPFPRPIDESNEFSARENSFNVFLSWAPKEKIKAMAMLRVYDLSGRALVESKPIKLDMKPGGQQPSSWWKAEISGLKPAIYRVDVFLDANPVWRAFFKIRE